jgi:hypothetical protein
LVKAINYLSVGEAFSKSMLRPYCPNRLGGCYNCENRELTALILRPYKYEIISINQKFLFPGIEVGFNRTDAAFWAMVSDK